MFSTKIKIIKLKKAETSELSISDNKNKDSSSQIKFEYILINNFVYSFERGIRFMFKFTS